MYFKEILLGTAVGDALGVPVEFCSWEYLQKYPVKEMMGWGTHNQPPGTVSDDTMLMYATGDGLLHDDPIPHIKGNFVRFSGELFDIGTQTSESIGFMGQERYPGELLFRQKLFLWNGQGNGSLMRIGIIFPLLLGKSSTEALVKIDEFSSLTHPSPVCTLGCAALFFFWKSMVEGKLWEECWRDTILNMSFAENSPYYKPYEELFETPLKNIESCFDYRVSNGMVVETLKRVIYSCVESTSFEEGVLKAVNSGEDTDTIGAITGMMLGCKYGYDSIPKEWIDALSFKYDLISLGEELEKKYS